MKSISFNAELATHLEKDGTQNILIRITQNRSHNRVGLGYSVEKKFWNFDENCVRKNHPMASMLNDYMKLKISELEKNLLQTKIKKKQITAKQLQQSIKNEVFGENFFVYARKVIARFENHKPDVNPFTLIDVPKAKAKRVRFTEEEILLIENMVTLENSVMFHSKNIFMLSFLHWGIRISDMLMLKYANINNGRLIYMAKKTIESQKQFNIKVHPRAEKILSYYLELPHNSDDFIFPFLKKLPKKFTDEELNKEIIKKTIQVNNELADIATKLALPKFSTNAARHSFAEITKSKTGNKKIVTEALGHSSEKVTEAYFNSASEYQNDELSNRVY